MDQFLEACYDGDLDSVKRLLPTVNRKSFDPIIYAGESGNVELVKYLVDAGFKIDNYHMARSVAKEGNLELVKYIISISPYFSRIREEALNSACQRGHLHIIKYLVRSGVNITYFTNAPIGWASRYGHLSAVKYLVSVGADVTDDENWAIRYAWKERRSGVIYYIVGYILNEMKRYTLLLLMRSVVHKDLLDLIVDKMVRYSEKYKYYQSMK